MSILPRAHRPAPQPSGRKESDVAIKSGLAAVILAVVTLMQACGGAEAQTATKEVAVQRVSYPQILGPAVGPYSDGVKHNGFLYLAGLSAVGTPQQGRPVPEQIDRILTTIEAIAAAERTSLRSLVKVTIYVTSLDDIQGIRETLFRHYGTNLPASSLVKVAGLFAPDVNAEIEAVFAVQP